MGRALTAAQNFSRNAGAMDSCTKRIFNAVQRWPLKLRLPVTHSFTATSRSASGRISAGFLASSPRMQRMRCGCGCWCLRMSATRLEPMNASASMRPLFMIGPMISAARAGEEIDHARREALGKRAQQRLVQQQAELGRS